MISEGEWQSISEMVKNAFRRKGEYFITGKVIKRDEDQKLVWMKEFGDQAIPIVGFDYEVTYYDTNQTGSVISKKAKVKVIVPKIGATVVVALEFGTRRLPRCLGVIQGTGWIAPSEE